ncbi:MAG: type IV secretion system DNA-binding domain-containing protein [Candidatus Komeilibacteria bacterium]|jgi:CxxC-x17-CxxC domain-containing protein|nr:type IV secretion system DNA-binding domain-containing protein [Candidatus Komeilibacteria bacterium]MBT4447691.1 type IV secretion system DNA-binding domain-containing protein [Candidatus Komeilibacteria bacterium]
MNDKITIFAETNYRNSNVKFGIKTDDRRRHMYFIGKTGMGKSTVLENMIIQDIQDGKGVCVVDPHGDLVEKVINFVPRERINDVIYFNPADLDFPIGFNVLEQVDASQRHLVVSGLIGVFQKIWADSWGPRLEYVLHHAISALLEYPGSTLLGIMRMLTDKAFRKKVVEKISDPVVKAFWVDEYSKYPDRFQAEAIAPIQNKVGRFLSSALIRNILGQVRSSFNMREIMDGQKILLLNLSKGRVGEDNSALLGAMMITKIQLAAMSRVDTIEEERKDFYLYVDEFQNFATESFANILSEARKYKLNLIIAHQYIEQVPEEMTAAVFGNVGTIVNFRVGAADAEFLEKEFFPTFTQEDLVNLSKFEIYIKLMIDGVTSEGFSAKTLPPVAMTEEAAGVKDKIINITRERYAKPREVIEDRIIRWAEGRGDEDVNVPATGTVAKTADRVVSKTTETTNREKKPRKRKPKDTGFTKNVVCDLCGKHTTINFDPDPKKPIYCRECLDLSRAGKVPPPSSIKIISDNGKEEEFTSLADALKGRKPSVKREESKIKPVETKKEVKKQIKEPSKEIRKTEDRVAKDLDPGEVIKF